MSGLAWRRRFIPFTFAVALGAIGGTPVLAQVVPPVGFDYRVQVKACPPGQPCFEQTWFVRKSACGFRSLEGWRPEGYGHASASACVKVR
jgi:hypothetical protein